MNKEEIQLYLVDTFKKKLSTLNSLNEEQKERFNNILWASIHEANAYQVKILEAEIKEMKKKINNL